MGAYKDKKEKELTAKFTKEELAKNKGKAAQALAKVQADVNKKVAAKTGGAAKSVATDEMKNEVAAIVTRKLAARKAVLKAKSDAKIQVDLAGLKLKKPEEKKKKEEDMKKLAASKLEKALQEEKKTIQTEAEATAKKARDAKLAKEKEKVQAAAKKKASAAKKSANKLTPQQQSLVKTKVKAKLQEIMDAYAAKKGIPSKTVKGKGATAA